MDTSQLHPIYELDHQSLLEMPIPGWLAAPLLVIFVVGIVSFLAYLIWWSKPERIWQRALKHIDTVTSGDGKHAVQKMLSITNEYMIQRFAVAQKGVTDIELLNHLVNSHDPACLMIKDDLKRLYELAIQIKFSNSIPFEIDADDIKRRCATIIRQTIPTDHMQ